MPTSHRFQLHRWRNSSTFPMVTFIGAYLTRVLLKGTSAEHKVGATVAGGGNSFGGALDTFSPRGVFKEKTPGLVVSWIRDLCSRKVWMSPFKSRTTKHAQRKQQQPHLEIKRGKLNEKKKCKSSMIRGQRWSHAS